MTHVLLALLLSGAPDAGTPARKNAEALRDLILGPADSHDTSGSTKSSKAPKGDSLSDMQMNLPKLPENSGGSAKLGLQGSHPSEQPPVGGAGTKGRGSKPAPAK